MNTGYCRVTVFVDLFGNIFDRRFDERIHGCDRFVQIGETDGIDMGFIYSHLNFQRSIVQSDI